MGTENINRENSSRSLQAALEYLARGWRPIPVHNREKKPQLKTWKEYQDRAPTHDEVVEWFTTWPDAGVAILTGAGSGLIVIDIDGPDGEQSLERVKGNVPTLTNVTFKGRHLLFAYPGIQISNWVKPAPGLDVRGDGGYIIVSPSIHASGHQYHWSGGHLDPAPLPPQLLVWLTNGKKSQGATAAVEEPIITQGGRNLALTKQAGSLFGRGVPFDEVLRLCREFNQLSCQPPLPDKEVERTIRSIAKREQAKKPAAVEPRWLRRGYIPFGKLTVIEGDPGLGKSTLTLDLAARISTGREMPDGSPGGPASAEAKEGLRQPRPPRETDG